MPEHPPDDYEDPRIAAAEYERDHPLDDPGEADHAAEREAADG